MPPPAGTPETPTGPAGPDPAGPAGPDPAGQDPAGPDLAGASPPARRRALLAAVAVAAGVLALVVAAVGAVSVLRDRGGDLEPLGQWQPAPGATAEPSPTGPPEPPAAISLSATGDIIFGDEPRRRLPPDDGDGFFDGVLDALAADVVMGNLEQPLTDDTGHRKCPEDSDSCFAFRAPPRYAAHLRDAGFDLMNLANNHGNDYGPPGRANTQAALTEHGIAHTGEYGEVTTVDAGGVSVAVLGFAPDQYGWTNPLNDLAEAGTQVARAAEAADLVVVQVHMGAEGSEQTRVRPGEELFAGENRGDPMAFSRAVIDAGADLVVGHGPHVLRGLEFYQGRLIAYSLGNFAGGGGMLNADGNLGLGAVLRVSLHPDGGFAGGELISTHMYDAGLPTVDPQQRSLALVRDLTERDFPDTGARIGPDGEITEP